MIHQMVTLTCDACRLTSLAWPGTINSARRRALAGGWLVREVRSGNSVKKYTEICPDCREAWEAGRRRDAEQKRRQTRRNVVGGKESSNV